jgi:hypothetical protein
LLGIVSDTTTPLTSTANTKFAGLTANVSWQNSDEVTARVILSQKTLADGIFAPVFPRYFENLASECFLQSLHW